MAPNILLSPKPYSYSSIIYCSVSYRAQFCALSIQLNNVRIVHWKICYHIHKYSLPQSEATHELGSFFFYKLLVQFLQGKYELRWRELYSEFVIKYSEMTLPHFWRGGNCRRDRRRRNLHISQIKYSWISHFSRL